MSANHSKKGNASNFKGSFGFIGDSRVNSNRGDNQECKMNESNTQFEGDENLLETTKINIVDQANQDIQKKLNVSNRQCFEQRSNRYSSNVKLMQRLKDKVNQDLLKVKECITQTIPNSALTSIEHSPVGGGSFQRIYRTDHRIVA